jgi:hypothetical protein
MDDDKSRRAANIDDSEYSLSVACLWFSAPTNSGLPVHAASATIGPCARENQRATPWATSKKIFEVGNEEEANSTPAANSGAVFALNGSKPRAYSGWRFTVSRPKSVSHIRSEICEAFDRPSGW